MSEQYRLVEDVVLLNGAVDTALYRSVRYHELGYDHQREQLLDDLRSIRDLADEVIEREEGDEVT